MLKYWKFYLILWGGSMIIGGLTSAMGYSWYSDSGYNWPNLLIIIGSVTIWSLIVNVSSIAINRNKDNS